MITLNSEFEFKVSLRCVSGKFLATIIPASTRLSGFEFAFYLLCNNVRIDARSYSENLTAVFSVPIRTGTYLAVGFAKCDEKKFIRKSDELIYYSDPPLTDRHLKFFEPIVRGSYSALKKNGYKARIDAVPIVISSPIKFENILDRNSDFAMHAWRFLDPIWNEYTRTNNDALIYETISYMNDWYSFRLSSKKNGFIWYDMATGIRAIHIALLTHIVKTRSFDLDKKQRKLIATLQSEHLFKLSEPSWLKLNNHGIWQVLGLRLLVWALGDGEVAALKLCHNKMKELLEFSFDREGVHTENSPFYHQYVSNLAIYLPEELFPESKEFIQAVKNNSREISMWLTDPCGMFYQIGDTEGKGVGFSSGMKFRSTELNCNYFIYNSYSLGYAVIRTPPDVDPAKSSALIFYGTNRHAVHSHADKLGFILFHNGIELFTDSGKYIYEYGEWQDYFLSDKAHNVLGLKYEQFGPKDVSYSETKIDNIRLTDREFLLSGKTAILNQKLSYRREMQYIPGDMLVITDKVGNGTNSSLELRFHLGIGVEAKLENDIVQLEYGGKAIAQLNIPANSEGVSILKGQESPIGGWCSKTYKDKKAINAIYIDFAKGTNLISTKIRFLC